MIKDRLLRDYTKIIYLGEIMYGFKNEFFLGDYRGMNENTCHGTHNAIALTNNV